MSEPFDPYYKWLGIPRSQQPPNHYRLLGLTLFEDNSDVIANAADRQMMLLRTFQTGEHAAFSQKLLNEVAGARIRLLQPAKKAEYDGQLRRQLDQEKAAQPTLSEAAALDFDPAATHPYAPLRRPKTARYVPAAIAAGAGTAVLVVAAVVWILFAGGEHAAPQPNDRAAQGDQPRPVPRPVQQEPRRPVLAPIADAMIEPGKFFTLSPRLADAGSPGVALKYSLGPGAPAEMQIDPDSGKITWATPNHLAAGEYPVAVCVASPGANPLKDEKTFLVRVTAAMPAPPKTVADVPPQQVQPGANKSVEVAKPEPPPTAKKLSIPDEASQKEALAAVKGQFKEEYRLQQPHARLPLAARLVRQAQQTKDKPAERYALLGEAREIAERAGDYLVELAALDELGKTFQVDADALKVEALGRAVRKPRSAASLTWLVQASLPLARADLAPETHDALVALLGQLSKAARKSNFPPLVQIVAEKEALLAELRRLYEASQAATAKLAGQPEEAQANLDRGLYLGLVDKDWDKALPLLAKGPAGKVRALAGKLAGTLASQPGDTAAQLALADLCWDTAAAGPTAPGARLLYREAAVAWYERAVPQLAGEDRAKVLARLIPQAAPNAARPLVVLLNGVGGLSAMPPEKQSGEVAPQGGFVTMAGTASLEYPQIPASSYVHEFEITFLKPEGALEFHYGEGDPDFKIRFAWDADQKKFSCRPETYRAGWAFWGGAHHYEPGRRLRFAFYVNENRQTLLKDDANALGTGARPMDLHLRITTGDNVLVAVHRCEFRRWTRIDAQRLNQPMPPLAIACDPPQTAVRLYQRNLGLKDKPALDNRPFVIAATGTPMVWIEPGKFERPPAKEGQQRTEVTISRGFWIGRYEVTQGEWAALLPMNVSRVSGSPFLPVDAVTWEQAMSFCRLLNEKEGGRTRRIPNGYEYRLPTEAEWEHACRAGAKDDFSVDAAGIWSAETSGGRPHEVGEGAANPWGLFDLHGNVREWCLDAWVQDPQPVWRLTDPMTLAKDTKGSFPIRGGCWWEGRGGCSSRARDFARNAPGGWRGFRMVLAPVIRAKP